MKILTVKRAQLKPAKYNPRQIDPAARAKLKTGMDTFGLVEPLVWNKRTGHLVGGHQRLHILDEQQNGEKKNYPVTVSVVDLDPKAERRLNLLLNNPKAQGAWDEQKLTAILEELGRDVTLTGFDESDIDRLINGDTGVDAEPQIDQADALRKQWKVAPGQIWQLGDHRLMCGDSTKPDDVAKLLAGAKPHLMVTDPPYGVDYDPGWRDGLGEWAAKLKQTGKVQNDHQVDWKLTYELSNCSVAYVWHAPTFGPEVSAHLERIGYEIVSQIIWAKSHFVMSRGDYHWRHESCIYAVKKGSKHNWQGARDQDTVWEIGNNTVIGKEGKTGHGTQKPIECMARPIRNNSKRGDLVYEPFSGSGTTIIACEQLGRKCRAMEISPGYVAVALQRWADATGKTPKLIDPK